MEDLKCPKCKLNAREINAREQEIMGVIELDADVPAPLQEVLLPPAVIDGQEAQPHSPHSPHSPSTLEVVRSRSGSPATPRVSNRRTSGWNMLMEDLEGSVAPAQETSQGFVAPAQETSQGFAAQ